MSAHQKESTDSSDQVRDATQSEVRLVCDILASAFKNDPVMAWLSGHPEIYSDMFYAEAKALYFKRGIAHIHSSKKGAALWTPPETSPEAPFHWSTVSMLWKMFRTGGIQCLNRGSVFEKIAKELHITEPHYYLFAIGAMQGQQGQGIGSRLLRTGLELVDQNPHPVYLESSNVKNNLLYQRFGFEVMNEVQLPDNGPMIWPMLRPARQ